MKVVPKKKYKKCEVGKDFDALIGMKYNMLTIKEILPRERTASGLLKPPDAICECECGNTKKIRLYDVINNNILSCGCIRGKKNICRNADEPSSIIDALSAIYYCNYPTTVCTRSKNLHLCCHECDRYENCPQRCSNSPDNCKAPIRDDYVGDDEGIEE